MRPTHNDAKSTQRLTKRRIAAKPRKAMTRPERRQDLAQRRAATKAQKLVPTPMTARAKALRHDDETDLRKNLDSVKEATAEVPSPQPPDPNLNRFTPLRELVDREEAIEQKRALETAVRVEYNRVQSELVDLKYRIRQPPTLRDSLIRPGQAFLEAHLQKISTAAEDGTLTDEFRVQNENTLAQVAAWGKKVEALPTDLDKRTELLEDCEDMADDLSRRVEETPNFKNSKTLKKELENLVARFHAEDTIYNNAWSNLADVRNTRDVKLPDRAKLQKLQKELEDIGAKIEGNIEDEKSRAHLSTVQTRGKAKPKAISAEWPYGRGDVVPHVHNYPSGSHLKILERGRVRRFNIEQNGKRHPQAADALLLTAGNPTLNRVIRTLLAGL